MNIEKIELSLRKAIFDYEQEKNNIWLNPGLRPSDLVLKSDIRRLQKIQNEMKESGNEMDFYKILFETIVKIRNEVIG